MVKRLTKFAQVAALGLALALTFSCSGDDGDEGGGGSACPSGSTSLDGVWEVEGQKLTISGSTGTVNGNQVYKGITSTGNLTWSGQERIDDGNGANVSWGDITLTMSADGQKLTVLSLDPVLYGETLILTRKCNNQSSGGSSSPSGGGGSTFKDTRDGKTYKTTKIGDQTWMAENLNYDVPGNDTDVCYDNDPANCTTYGRLYDWETANTACPSGWKLPSDEDWNVLFTAVGGSETAGKYLKAKSGWNGNGNGEDKYGFSALPGGYGSSGGSFYYVGNLGYWWSASEYDSYSAYLRDMFYDREYAHYYNDGKSLLFSVRCVKD